MLQKGIYFLRFLDWSDASALSSEWLFSAFAKFLGAVAGEGPPVPIPNTVVKLTMAESTWALGPGRIGRRQDYICKNPTHRVGFFILIEYCMCRLAATEFIVSPTALMNGE